MHSFPLCPLQDRPGKGVFGDGFDIEGGLQDLRRRDSGGGEDVRHLRFAAGQGAGLVENDRPEAVGVLQALPPLIRMPFSAPSPVPTMTAVGVASPRAHGQAMTRTETKLSSARLKTGSGTRNYQTAKVTRADPEDDGDEDGGDLVRQPLDRGLGSLRLLDEADDPRQRRLGADPRRPEREAPGPVERRGEDLRPRLLGDRHALPGQHRLVDAGIPGDDHAVRRDLLPGPDNDEIAFDDPFDGNIGLYAFPDDAGRLRLQPDQALDGLGGLPLRPRLQKPAEDDQSDDEGRPVVIDVGHDLRPGEEPREEGRERRIEPGRKPPTATSVFMSVVRWRAAFESLKRMRLPADSGDFSTI